MDRILILNAAYMPIGLVHWMKAVCLMVTERAEVVVDGGRTVRSPSTELRLPQVLKVRGPVRMRQKGLRLNRRNLLRRDGHTCQYCGKQPDRRRLTMDHVVPRVAGGRTTWTNVVTACERCNSRKGGRTPDQAGMRLLRAPRRPEWDARDQVLAELASVPTEWEAFLPVRKQR